jgi:cyclophilin family peptidyl-prolyl cis-trans isomerase
MVFVLADPTVCFLFLQRLPKKLDGKHVVFGQVLDGMDVVHEIEAQGQATGVPKARVVIVNSGQLSDY